jgi:hypothetical protein
MLARRRTFTYVLVLETSRNSTEAAQIGGIVRVLHRQNGPMVVVSLAAWAEVPVARSGMIAERRPR